jgi:hypothetical protein
MKYLLIILLFTSCSTLRHYKKVYNDKDRDPEERELLAKASAEEFPPRIEYIRGKDSTVYRDTIIEIPGETFVDTFAIPCPDYEIDRPKVTVKIKDGRGTVTCKADSLKVVLDSVIRLTGRTDTIKQVDSVNLFLRQVAEQKVETYQKNERELVYIIGLLFKWLSRQWWFYVLIAIGIVYLLFRLQILKGKWISKIVSGIVSWFS